MKNIILVLVRHGESEWNKKSKFTGWEDVNLTKHGYLEAKYAGDNLKKAGFVFDYAYTSYLKRAIYTLWNILIQMNQPWIHIEKSWKLNERHYGALQGLSKLDVIKQYGDQQVQMWRRGFYAIPPKINICDSRYPGNDIRYSNIKNIKLPVAESLSMTFERVVSFWKDVIYPKVIMNNRIIIVAHGNTLRMLIKYLSNINTDNIIDIEIPTGIPIIYEIYENIKFNKYHFLY
uniref:2,3-bisphosphoglycerate-dependent phosphoglycerate mutase n=1 Tax=Candidatus Aschnera chinzeii TaxID=1485666 RepID=A0AAT9G4N0_9ENTR|nr:MAG: 2,3-diphosphoglycerate-dependent phosphoglycerate mutase [Candidatus Aschnera chinzeii]